MAAASLGRHGEWGTFGAWLLVGTAYGVAVVGIASIGLFVLPFVLAVGGIATLVLRSRRGPPASPAPARGGLRPGG